MKLPDKKSEINRNFKDQKFGMIGPSGIGKSEFWTHSPKAFFIESEPGLNAYEVFKLPARDWEDIASIYKLLRSEAEKPEFPYSIIILDTIDRIVDYAGEMVVARAKNFYKSSADKINTIGDIPNGAGWFKTKEMVMGFLIALETLPCAIAYIGHLANKTIKPDIGQEYTRQTISIGGQLGESLLAWTDHTLHVKAQLRGDTLVRTVYTKPTQSREAKSRGSVIPNGWKWNIDSKANYEEFRKFFT